MRKDAPPSPGLLGPFGAVVGALFRRNGANKSAQGNALGRGGATWGSAALGGIQAQRPGERRRHPNPRALPWADLLGPFGAGVGMTGNVLLHSVIASYEGDEPFTVRGKADVVRRPVRR